MVGVSFLGPLALFIWFLVFFIYVLLFGQSDYHRNGVIGRINRFFTQRIPKILDQIAKRIFGPRLYRVWVTIEKFCFYSRNPLLQIFYISLVGGGFIMYYFIVLPRLPLHHQIISWIIVSCTLASFFIASFSDPGRITKENLHQYEENYEFDGVLYVPKTCRTCLIKRPARSKHCRLCDMCVSRYDHHCPWINTCVGAKNIRWFIIFLVCTFILCEFGAFYSLYTVWYDIIVRYRLLELRRGNAPLSYTLILQYIIYYGGPGIFGLAVMGIFAGLAVLCFLLYHTYLIARNATTQESVKWSYANYVYEEQEPIRKEVQSRMEAGEKFEDIIDSIARQGKYHPEDLVLMSEPVNIYQRGFFSNLYEIFFPYCERSNKKSTPVPKAQAKRKARDEKHIFPPYQPKVSPLTHEDNKSK